MATGIQEATRVKLGLPTLLLAISSVGARLYGDPVAADCLALAYLAAVTIRGGRLGGLRAAARLNALPSAGRTA